MIIFILFVLTYNNATTSGNIHNLTMQARIGRPRAPTTIVDNVIPALQLTQERYLLRDIHRVSADIDSTIQWFARRGLLANSQQCCNEPMGFTSREKNKDEKVWYCRTCKRVFLGHLPA